MAEKAGMRIVSTRTITPNLWTVLRYKNWRAGADERCPSEVWGAAASTPAKVSFKRKVINKGLHTLLTVLNPVLALVNRLIDMTGFGDSLLVILSKRH